MYTIVITTKKQKYLTIVQNWFPNSVLKEVESTIEYLGCEQSHFNLLRVVEEGDYRLVLPEVVSQDLLQEQKSEYILDLLCVIADTFQVDKNNYYGVVHSRDLFSLEDNRSGYGRVSLQSLSCADDLRVRVANHFVDRNIHQFHHESNPIASLLLYQSLNIGHNHAYLGSRLKALFP